MAAGTGVTDTTRCVTRLCALLTVATFSYTQVLPTAMGNGTDPVGTNEFEVALAVAAGVPALAATEGEPPAAVLLDAAPDVLADPPHPASVITAAPARTARAELNLLMSMPRSAR